MSRKQEQKEAIHWVRDNYHGYTFEKLVDYLPVKTLLKMGHAVAGTDFATRFYYNKQHPKFHLNKNALRHALRRAWSIGYSNHRERICRILEESWTLKEEVEKRHL